MTATPSIELPTWMAEQLSQASPDLLRQMVQIFAEALMSADADAVCGAGYGQRSPDLRNIRNGYRWRGWDTRVGSIELAVPKLRQGSYFPDWLLERRRRAESALVSVVATSYLLGVSTRRMEKLVQTLGITGLSKSQVSEMAKGRCVQPGDLRPGRPDPGLPDQLADRRHGRPHLLRRRHCDHPPRRDPPAAGTTRAGDRRDGKPIIARLSRCIEGRSGARLLKCQQHLRAELAERHSATPTVEARATAALVEARRHGVAAEPGLDR
jgi:hypothetical protein